MDENESGLFDAERRRWDEEQEMLKADPAYLEWLEMIDKRTNEELH